MKRTVDVIVAGLALIALSPIIGVVALLVRLKLGSPVLFCQVRPGMNEEPFTMLKFRSMLSEGGSDAERLTPFGRRLRATSLDELPELLNVLRGEMSLVGPRPLLVEYLPLYNDRQRQRHEVRPGLTGLAQSSGRNSLSWSERFELDVEYVENVSLRLDAKIMWMTLRQLARRSGITADGEATMGRFEGNDSGAATG